MIIVTVIIFFMSCHIFFFSPFFFLLLLLNTTLEFNQCKYESRSVWHFLGVSVAEPQLVAHYNAHEKQLIWIKKKRKRKRKSKTVISPFGIKRSWCFVFCFFFLCSIHKVAVICRARLTVAKKKKRKTFVLLSTCNKRIQWLFLCCSGATDGSLRPSFTHMKVCLRVSNVLFFPQ